MQTVTLSALVALLPLVANQPWSLDTWDMVRNDRSQCPVCAMVQVIDPAINKKDNASAALEILLGRSLHEDENKSLSRFIEAIDADNDCEVLLRREVMATLHLAPAEV